MVHRASKQKKFECKREKNNIFHFLLERHKKMSENSDELEALPRASTSKSDKSSSYRQKKSKNECKENVDLICIK